MASPSELEDLFEVGRGRVGITLVRIHSILARTRTFDQVRVWLRTPQTLLAGSVPLNLIAEGYASAVRDILEIKTEK